jgi:predicted component of type VI protein secretion system
VQAEEQILNLCFPTPIWRLNFSDYEPVNQAIRKEMAQLDWDKLMRRINQHSIRSIASGKIDSFPWKICRRFG